MITIAPRFQAEPPPCHKSETGRYLHDDIMGCGIGGDFRVVITLTGAPLVLFEHADDARRWLAASKLFCGEPMWAEN